MEKSYLIKTRQKLTILFTVLVFFACLLLWLAFLSVKYFHEIKLDRQNFIFATNTITNRFTNLRSFISIYDIWNNLFKRGDNAQFQRRSPLWENGWPKWDRGVNFVLIDKDGAIVFQNIKDSIEWKVLEWVYKNLDYNRIYGLNGYFLKLAEVNGKWEKYNIIFFKQQRYDVNDYISDILRFLWVLSIFIIIIYITWYTFVKRNLKPVEENLSDMQDFIHNAWHELKTPISILHGNMQIMKTLKKYDKDLVSEGIREVERLDKLIEGLIDLSSIHRDNHISVLNVAHEIQEILKDFERKISSKKIKIYTKFKSETFLKVNKEYLYIVISNLLSNAIRYSKEKGKITILLHKNKLIIKDEWVGIKWENFENIFKRFFREKNARDVTGFWIWLSLVKKISDIYNWKIDIESKEGEWTSFIINF